MHDTKVLFSLFSKFLKKVENEHLFFSTFLDWGPRNNPKIPTKPFQAFLEAIFCGKLWSLVFFHLFANFDPVGEPVKHKNKMAANQKYEIIINGLFL